MGRTCCISVYDRWSDRVSAVIRDVGLVHVDIGPAVLILALTALGGEVRPDDGRRRLITVSSDPGFPACLSACLGAWEGTGWMSNRLSIGLIEQRFRMRAWRGHRR